MKKVIAKKTKRAVTEAIFTGIIILFLIALSVYRLVLNKDGIAMIMVYVGLILISIYWFVIETIQLIKNIKLPKELIFIEDNVINLYVEGHFVKVNQEDIKEVTLGRIDKRPLLYQSDIKILTVNSEYIVRNILDAPHAKEELDKLIIKGE